MCELVVATNIKNARAKFSYYNFKRNERKIIAKQTHLLQNLII